jgi:hypothetical protein
VFPRIPQLVMDQSTVEIVAEYTRVLSRRHTTEADRIAEALALCASCDLPCPGPRKCSCPRLDNYGLYGLIALATSV